MSLDEFEKLAENNELSEIARAVVRRALFSGPLTPELERLSPAERGEIFRQALEVVQTKR